MVRSKRTSAAVGILVLLVTAGTVVLMWKHAPTNAETLAVIALRHQGDTAYEAAKWNGWYRPGSNKCNKAVADWIVDSGHPRPFVRGHFGLIPRDPSAHEWADPKINIKGWSAPMQRTEALPGDVIAQEHGPIYGHGGIVVGQGSTVSAYGDVQPQGLVLQDDWGFRTGAGANGESGVDPAPTVRRYIEE
ncbi:hypothetical protein HDF16_000526 [Granulicella aggregans]|uniref:CHAP domain-containing protein n=1 Tax=Granulicella aggregans TaxID=474949 RepID=A0A7W7Z9X4_9BACT|nr:hypothetical protein [Granulicella aggregans]MBB5055857.1 hypothetical protein [Granulicella aggregans]